MCTELRQLNTTLWVLEVQTNRLTGPIPSEMGQMDALNHLFAQDNKLSSEIPEQVQELLFGPSFLLFNISGNDDMLEQAISSNETLSLLHNGQCWINSTYTPDCSQRNFLYSQTCRCGCNSC